MFKIEITQQLSIVNGNTVMGLLEPIIDRGLHDESSFFALLELTNNVIKFTNMLNFMTKNKIGATSWRKCCKNEKQTYITQSEYKP